MDLWHTPYQTPAQDPALEAAEPLPPRRARALPSPRGTTRAAAAAAAASPAPTPPAPAAAAPNLPPPFAAGPSRALGGVGAAAARAGPPPRPGQPAAPAHQPPPQSKYRHVYAALQRPGCWYGQVTKGTGPGSHWRTATCATEEEAARQIDMCVSRRAAPPSLPFASRRSAPRAAADLPPCRVACLGTCTS